jgi:hypothetical protein
VTFVDQYWAEMQRGCMSCIYPYALSLSLFLSLSLSLSLSPHVFSCAYINQDAERRAYVPPAVLPVNADATLEQYPAPSASSPAEVLPASGATAPPVPVTGLGTSAAGPVASAAGAPAAEAEATALPVPVAGLGTAAGGPIASAEASAASAPTTAAVVSVLTTPAAHVSALKALAPQAEAAVGRKVPTPAICLVATRLLKLQTETTQGRGRWLRARCRPRPRSQTQEPHSLSG